MEIEYEDKTYTLDLDEMDTDQAREMERFGVPSLLALEEGTKRFELKSLQVYYWLCLVQNGAPGQRLDRVQFKPVKFAKALALAALKAREEAEIEAVLAADESRPEHSAPKDVPTASTVRVSTS